MSSYDRQIDSGKISSGSNPAVNRIYCTILMLQYDDYTFSIIVTMNWTKFLYKFYSNNHFLVYSIKIYFNK